MCSRGPEGYADFERSWKFQSNYYFYLNFSTNKKKTRSLDTLQLDLKTDGTHPGKGSNQENWPHNIRRADTATKRGKHVKMTMMNLVI